MNEEEWKEYFKNFLKNNYIYNLYHNHKKRKDEK